MSWLGRIFGQISKAENAHTLEGAKNASDTKKIEKASGNIFETPTDFGGNGNINASGENSQVETLEQEFLEIQDAVNKGYDAKDFDVNEDETVKALNKKHDEIADKMSEAALKGDNEAYQKLNDELYTLNNDIDAAKKTAKEKNGISDNTITKADDKSTIQSKVIAQNSAKAETAKNEQKTDDKQDNLRTYEEINTYIEKLENECPGNVGIKFEDIKKQVNSGKITQANAQAEMKKILEQTQKWQDDYVKLTEELDKKQETLEQKKNKLLNGTDMSAEEKAKGWSEVSKESGEISKQRTKLSELAKKVQ